MHREAVERRGLRSWAVRGTERGLEKRRGGGGEREEIHETSIRFARTHTHGLQIIIIKVPRLCSLVPARVTRLCPPGALALLFYLHLSCIVHRTPDAPPSMAKWRCRTALSFSFSLSRSLSFLSDRPSLVGGKVEKHFGRIVCLPSREVRESYGSVGIVNSGINVSSS